jgi:hypothetical protein
MVLSLSPGFAAKQGKEKVDSLLDRLAIHKTDDTAKIALYRDIALEYYFKALKISEEIGDKKGIARKLGNIGTIYKERGECRPFCDRMP